MIKICCITYKDIDRLMRETLKTYHDEETEFFIVEGLRTELLEGEKRRLIESADAAIAAGANAQIAAAGLNIPVLSMHLTVFDYLMGIEEARKLGNSPVIVTYREPLSPAMKEYLSMIGRQADNVVYEDTEELREKILQSRADVVIGATHAAEIGRQLGKKTVLICPSYQCIVDTIQAAKSLVKELRKEQRKNQYINALLQCSVNGVILVDSFCRVIDFNNTAVKLAGMGREALKNAYLDQLFPRLKINEFVWGSQQETSRIVRLGEEEVCCNIVRLENGHSHFDGAVIILYYLEELKSELRKQERESRQRSEKGFRAKNYFSSIIGSSPALTLCMEDARIYAQSESNLMIYGETGTGKELFAQSVHNASRRKREAFIAVNCAALPENLLETELFGYDEGAFTGTRKGGKKGLFELADRGTLFLDEIGELSAALQSRLLRALQEKEIMHVGGEKIIPVDVRVISATNRRLDRTRPEEFRRDLLYRLNVLELVIPPLRDRDQDVLELFEYYYQKKQDVITHQTELTPGVREVLMLYDWPGNIRELQNVCERFCLYLKQTARQKDPFVKKCMIRAIGEERFQQSVLARYGFPESGVRPELVEALKRIFSYNREQIAGLLGTSRTTIWRMMREQDGEEEKEEHGRNRKTRAGEGRENPKRTEE